MNEDSKTPETNKPRRRRKGSLQRRRGKWYAVLTVTQDGERIRKWFPLETDSKQVAQLKMARLVEEQSTADLATIAARPELYRELADRVTAMREDDGIADTGSEGSRERLWILPEIGELTVASIRTEHIATIYEKARQAGKSLSHLRHLRTILHSRFAVAIQEETIVSSPVAKVRIPRVRVDKRERAVLTDPELALYLAWQHPDENRRLAVLERQTMSAVSRCFGGARTGDLHTLQWKQFDAPDFTIGTVPRKKTERPQRIEIPAMLRPILLEWWRTSHVNGNPPVGLMFPALRGDNAGEGEKQHTSHARALRRDLRRVFGLDKWDGIRFVVNEEHEVTPRERELLFPTEQTRPLDFHSWRRAFCQAVAGTGLNAQQAKKLSGHADLSALNRYLENTSHPISIPVGALPDLRVSSISVYEMLRARQDSNLRPPASKCGLLAKAAAEEGNPTGQVIGDSDQLPRVCETDSRQRLPLSNGDAGHLEAAQVQLRTAIGRVGQALADELGGAP